MGPTSSLLEHGPAPSQVPAGPLGPGQDVCRWHIALCRLMGFHQGWSASIGVVRDGALAASWGPCLVCCEGRQPSASDPWGRAGAITEKEV